MTSNASKKQFYHKNKNMLQNRMEWIVFICQDMDYVQA